MSLAVAFDGDSPTSGKFSRTRKRFEEEMSKTAQWGDATSMQKMSVEKIRQILRDAGLNEVEIENTLRNFPFERVEQPKPIRRVRR